MTTNCSGLCVTCSYLQEHNMDCNNNYSLASMETLLLRLKALNKLEKIDTIKKRINLIKGTLIVEYGYTPNEKLGYIEK